MKWISVKDRMPPETDEYRFLVCGRFTPETKFFVMSAIYLGIDNGFFTIETGNQINEVTHWIQFPELPKN